MMTAKMMQMPCMKIFAQFSLSLDLFLKIFMHWCLSIESGGPSNIVVLRFLSGWNILRHYLLTLLRDVKAKMILASKIEQTRAVQRLSILAQGR